MLILTPVKNPYEKGWGKHIRECEPKILARPLKKCLQNEHTQWVKPILSLLIT